MTQPAISPARRAAFDLLLQLHRRPQTHSDELLRGRSVEALAPLDRNLCTALVMGVLRWQMTLEERIRAALTHPEAQLSLELLLALQLGAFQLLYMDRIPPHAAIFESVELVKHASRLAGQAHAAGLANAVLRRISRLGKERPPLSPGETPDAIADAYAHPRWLVAGWVETFGVQAAAAICAYDQAPPSLTVRVADAAVVDALQSEGVELAPGRLVARAMQVVEGDVSGTRAFAQGLVRLQDEGSQLVAELAGEGSVILDCCAAPGGKTALLAERNPHSAITACDISPPRLRAMERYLAALNRNRSVPISFVIADATKLPAEPTYDLVLCDAPCSGTGTLARNPEIRHRLLPEHLERQHARQVDILCSALRTLRPGGRLVYATCSLEPEENEQVIAEVLEACAGFHLISWRDRLQELEGRGVLRTGTAAEVLRHSSSENFVRTLPGMHACDGFFAAQIARD